MRQMRSNWQEAEGINCPRAAFSIFGSPPAPADLRSHRAAWLALPLASTLPIPRIRLVSKNNSSWAALGVGVIAVVAVVGA